MHSDHYQGLSNKWNYGPIYCSVMTKQVLLNKWPLLSNVIGLELNKEYEVCLNAEKNLKVKVTLFDANHIAGSAMFLFEGDMGTFFHTGDFRFDEYMFKEYKKLYPKNLGAFKTGIPKSIKIDELIFDNTYCDPIFQFPKRDKCVRSIIRIIEDNSPCDVYISTYNLGKEEVLVELADYFNTKVVVTKDRYKDIVAMDFKPRHFTTVEDEGWIFCKKWKDRSIPIDEVVNSERKVIKISPTGWANIKDILMVRDREYIVPYSSHSNFKELEKFVSSISPAVLKCVVRKTKNSFRKIGNIKQLTSYMFTLQTLEQRGYDFFVEKYVDVSRASENYTKYMRVEYKEELMKTLGLKLNAEQEQVKNRKSFEEKNKQVFKAKKRSRFNKGAKFKKPESNPSLRIEDVMLLNQLKVEFAKRKTRDTEFDEGLMNDKDMKKAKPNKQ